MKHLFRHVAVLSAVFILYGLFCHSNEIPELNSTVSIADQSLFKTIRYQHGTCTLILTFRSGAVYEYQAVPYSIYSGLVNTSSKGAFFNQHIRRQYACARIE